MSKVLFLHSPKTGGTTFRAILRRAYPRFAVCADADVDVIREHLDRCDAVEILTAESASGGTMFANHELMREQHWDVLRGVDVFVMVREPVDLAVSLYHHIARNRESRRVRGAYADHPASRAFTLEDFVADPHHANLQLSFLVGNLPFHSGRITDAGDLAHGLRLLDELRIHVGVTERFADFLHLFETVTGKTIPGRTVERHNVDPDGAARPVLHSALRSQLAQANALDGRLHAHARRIVQRQADVHGPPPGYQFVGRLSPDR